MIDVLVVDDSAFMRKAITMMLETDSNIRVVGTARDGRDAVRKTEMLLPDVITMDVEMPRLDGISAVHEIMSRFPRPILMISSMTQSGADATIAAMEAGAVDFISKDLSNRSLEITKIQDTLIERVKVVSQSERGIRGHHLVRKRPSTGKLDVPSRTRIVVLAVSTGGPAILQHIIRELDGAYPLPILIVQHMPPHFTRSLAERLDAASKVSVMEARHGMRLQKGAAFLAAGGRQMVLRESTLGISIATPDDADEMLYKPSADATLSSASDVFGDGVLGVILTGMGDDGLRGSRDVKAHGGLVIAQHPDTCVVSGMPRAVIEDGLADAVLTPEEIVTTLTDITRRARVADASA